jgi:hypothetical protein
MLEKTIVVDGDQPPSTDTGDKNRGNQSLLGQQAKLIYPDVDVALPSAACKGLSEYRSSRPCWILSR